MEASDFDKILKNKIAEPSDLHEKEMNSAKPFVWSAVNKEIKGTSSLTWYHMAAAVLLFLVSFSIILFYVQNSHERQLLMLSEKIDLLEINHQNQLSQLVNKNTELSTLLSHQDNSIDEKVESPSQVIEKVIYRTDTVYIKKVEYVTVIQKPDESESLVASNLTDTKEEMTIAKLNQNTTDEIIFPSRSLKDNKVESTKIKFTPFSSRSN